MNEQRNSGTNGAQRGAFSTQQTRGLSSPQVRRSEVVMARSEVPPTHVSSQLRSYVDRPITVYSVPASRAFAPVEVRDNESRLQQARRSLHLESRMPLEEVDPMSAPVRSFSNVDSEVAASRQLLRRSPTNEVLRSSVELSGSVLNRRRREAARHL